MSPLDTLGRAPCLARRSGRRSTCEDGGLARILGADASRPGDPPWPGTGAHVSSVAFPDSRGRRKREGTADEPVVLPEQRRARGAGHGAHTPGAYSAASSLRGGTGGSGERSSFPVVRWLQGGWGQDMGSPRMLKGPKAPISWTGPCLKAGWSFPGAQ